jgi:hypothetical protein
VLRDICAALHGSWTNACEGTGGGDAREEQMH